MEQTEFRESNKSLKHELGSDEGSSVLVVSLWQSGRISVSHMGGSGFEHRSNPSLKHYHFVTEFTEFSESI